MDAGIAQSDVRSAPHGVWATQQLGGQAVAFGRQGAIRGVLKELADYFTETLGEEVTPGAVESQVAYGLTAQREYKDRSLVRNFILNKAAALEVGFITSAGLPNYLNARRDDA